VTKNQQKIILGCYILAEELFFVDFMSYITFSDKKSTKNNSSQLYSGGRIIFS
jgi:hypothetical protein